MKSSAHVPPSSARRRLRALVLVPDPDQPGLTVPQRVALRIRNDATLTGRCACGATSSPIYQTGEIRILPMEHEPSCPATSRAIERLAERAGLLKYLYLVVEIEVAA